ncbi:TPA: sensor domain-containing diguanylate cyclase [Kluyvera intermedia]|uniref:Diguanylate cyclase n=2 Tax=Enterobacteriaceae TaxID=543 RepID=A0AAC8QKS6_9ENTR|nr:sensor domain-containing diguanylate cyclase [Phytobacter ursingii]HAT2206045.1 sensor domain-containing diguanylate cyclase [Kluyvera intermedia]AKL10561.1 diguanylate cyclase [Phytobacter ursingii]HAT2515848.1 sensor domain-containing diguanylate cyclase [Kluyvera intermedia]HAT2603938.1 sensor domain-containing diguanylate cyclase [Kluyvera intermedia]HAT2680834.1 sensor domain-containing diguanylate cyclase [Kluyvera intermedia]
MLNEIIVAGRKLELEDVHFMEDNAFVSLVFDTAGRIIFANSYFCQLSGFGSEEITGKVLFRATDEALCSSVLSAINIILLTGETWHGEIYQPKKNGEQLWLDARLTPRKDEHGEVFAFVMLGFDITRHMTIREKLHYRAHNDALTRTLNRQGYFIRSRKKIRAARAHGAHTFVAILDLDNFKIINDDLGHAAGDEVLRCFISRVKNCISQDTLLGRLGGDEFALTFIEGIDEPDGRQLLQHIVEETRQPMTITSQPRPVGLSVSIGVARYPEHGPNFSSVLKAADTALYKVKAQGGDDFINYQVIAVTDPGGIISTTSADI